MKGDRLLDVRGMLCPMPIVKLSKAIRDAASGEVIEMLADDEGAWQDVPAWAKKTGNEYLGSERADSYSRHFVRKT